MIIRINGGPVLDKINEWSEDIIEKEAEWVFRPIVELAEKGALYAIHVLNTYSVEIITLGIIVCAFGMMVGPLVGSARDKWLGRLFAITLGGVIWRLII